VTTSKEATSRKVVFPPGEVLRPQNDFIGMRFQSRRHEIIHRLTCSQLKTGNTEYDQRLSKFAFLSGSSSFHLAIDHRREFNLEYAELIKAARSVGVLEFGYKGTQMSTSMRDFWEISIVLKLPNSNSN
jgi:hypothetical protein